MATLLPEEARQILFRASKTNHYVDELIDPPQHMIDERDEAIAKAEAEVRRRWPEYFQQQPAVAQ
jgi:hypothetical protein